MFFFPILSPLLFPSLRVLIFFINLGRFVQYDEKTNSGLVHPYGLLNDGEHIYTTVQDFNLVLRYEMGLSIIKIYNFLIPLS